MPSRRREPPRLALAALACAALAACAPSGRPDSSGAPSAPSSPPAAATATAAPGTSAPPTRTPAPRHVIGVLGDYGVDAAPVRQVVRALGRLNGGAPLHAVVTTGDNAYCCGTARQSAFARRMLDPLRRRGTPLYPALGNHDVATEDGAALLRAFGMTRRWYAVEVGPVQVVVLDSTRTSDPRQLAFLQGVLAKPRPGSFRVVAFHHPAWSCSAHDPDAGVRDRWLPLLGTKVDLVLAGHNHTYERFAGAGGVPYVTTGGGGASLYASNRLACRGAGSARRLETVHHAVRLVATAATLRLDAVDVDGAVFDTVAIARR